LVTPDGIGQRISGLHTLPNSRYSNRAVPALVAVPVIVAAVRHLESFLQLKIGAGWHIHIGALPRRLSCVSGFP